MGIVKSNPNLPQTFSNLIFFSFSNIQNKKNQLFGGEHSTPSQMQFYHYKDLWVFRIASRKWEKIQSKTIQPSPRSGHRMISMKQKLFVFGGFYDTGVSYKYYNDVWMFSLETYQWQQIDTIGSIIPQPRSAACMTSTPDGKILIFGGYSKTSVKKEIDRGITHSDMFMLAPESKFLKIFSIMLTSKSSLCN